MQELTSVLWVCTKCGKIFTGQFDGDVGMLPCGHHFGIAAAPEEVIRSIFVFRLECLINE